MSTRQKHFTRILLILSFAAWPLYAQQSNIQFDQKGFLVLEGQSQFPLAIFVAFLPGWVDSDPDLLKSNLDDIKNSPFNIMINYAGNSGTLEQKKRYYEQIHQRRLWEFFSIEKYFKHIGHTGWQIEFEGTEQEAVTNFVNQLKDLPGLLGWYLWDELPRDPQLVRQHHLWAKAADPHHPTLILTSQQKSQELAQFADAGDIYALDRYPLPVRGDITLIAQAMDNLVQATPSDKPLWFTVQGFGDYVYGAPRSDGPKINPANLRGRLRAPTPAEMRRMTYLTLTHGAKGIIFYYHKDFQLSYDYQTRWPAVKAIAADVKQLESILMADDYNGRALRGDNLNIHWLAKTLNGKIYLIAVNATRELQSIIFNLPNTMKITQVLQGHASHYLKENHLLLTMDGYNTMALELAFTEKQ